MAKQIIRNVHDGANLRRSKKGDNPKEGKENTIV
jgi:hypothetical protein